jgi:hypothetical protein
MAGDTSGSSHGVNGMIYLEDELTRHLERANELGRQAKLANDAVEEELRLARQIADALRGATTDR